MEASAIHPGTGNVEPDLKSLVASHLDLVYSAALRQVRDPHLAEDVTQGVFLVAATKRRGLPPHAAAAWLLVVTRFVALATLRAQRRRRNHERAFAMTIPSTQPGAAHDALEASLDRALAALMQSDRQLIYLRYFQDLSIPQVAAKLGITDNTASKRVGRALEKLRRHFRRHGVHLSTDALAAAILVTALKPAPRALGAQIIGAAATPVTLSATSVTLGVFLMNAAAQANMVAALLLLAILLIGSAVVTLHPWPPATPVAPPNSIQAAAATPIPTSLADNFPLGGSAELLGINSSANPGIWWSPDGTPLAQSFAAPDFSKLKDPFGETRATVRMAVRLTDLPDSPRSIYLYVSGNPRTECLFPMERSETDPSLFYGAALLYPEQPETTLVDIVYSTLPWNTIMLDTDGHPQPPLPANLPGGDRFLSSVFPKSPFSRVREQNGHTLLGIGMEVWLGDYEFTTAALASDGTFHPATNVLTGPITGGDQYDWSFNLPPGDIQSFQVSIRQCNQMVRLARISVQAGHKTQPTRLSRGGSPGNNYFDQALYNQLFQRDLGEAIRTGNLPAATQAAGRLIAELDSRRQHLHAEDSPNLYLIDKIVPVVTQIQAALNRGDLAAATALLQADSVTGRRLQDTMQKLAMTK